MKNGQNLLPMVELIEQSQQAVDELIDVLGRATIEAVLKLSAQWVAGPPHPGKKGGAIGLHGRESDGLFTGTEAAGGASAPAADGMRRLASARLRWEPSSPFHQPGGRNEDEGE